VPAAALLEALAVEVVARNIHDTSTFKAKDIACLAFAFGNNEQPVPNSVSAVLPGALIRELLECADSGDATVVTGLTTVNSIAACGPLGLWLEALQLLEYYLSDGDGNALGDALNAAAVVFASSGDNEALSQSPSLIIDTRSKFAHALATTDVDTQFTVHNTLLVGARRVGDDIPGDELQRRIEAASLQASRPEAIVQLPTTKK
jgi:hypothetical protein